MAARTLNSMGNAGQLTAAVSTDVKGGTHATWGERSNGSACVVQDATFPMFPVKEIPGVMLP